MLKKRRSWGDQTSIWGGRPAAFRLSLLPHREKETYAAMDALASKYPNLASKVKIGQSWEKIHSVEPQDTICSSVVLTNKSKPAAGKSKYFVMGETPCAGNIPLLKPRCALPNTCCKIMAATRISPGCWITTKCICCPWLTRMAEDRRAGVIPSARM